MSRVTGMLTWQKVTYLLRWYTWHRCSPGKKVTYLPGDTLLTWQKCYLFWPWYTWHPAHLAKKLLILTMIYLTQLLTWQKSNLFSPWYTWHPAHLAKQLLILTMIYLTPCSPGKKVTYSDHDIPDTLLTWQKSNLFWPWYTWHTAYLAKK